MSGSGGHIGDPPNGVDVPQPNEAEEERIREEAVQFLRVPSASGGTRALHIDLLGDGSRLCTSKAETLIAKDPSVYPPGYADFCGRCLWNYRHMSEGERQPVWFTARNRNNVYHTNRDCKNLKSPNRKRRLRSLTLGELVEKFNGEWTECQWCAGTHWGEGEPTEQNWDHQRAISEAAEDDDAEES